MFTFHIRGENIAITDAIRDYAETKLSKLEKYFAEDVTVHVTAKVYPNKQAKAEVTIPHKDVTLRAEETSNDWYNSLNVVVDKLERQMRKHKTKLQKRNRVEKAHDNSDIDDEPFARIKDLDIETLSPQEALNQMDLLGHDFFIFLNEDTARVSVVYHRKNGSTGLLNANYDNPFAPVGKEFW